MNLKIEINKIKSIENFTIELPLDRGLYAIAGENTSGKSTLVACASTVFFNMPMYQYFGKPVDGAYISFELGEAKRKWEFTGKWINTHGASLVNAKKDAALGIAFYKPYYSTEFLYPLFDKTKNIDAGKLGLMYDPKSFRDTYYYEGILRVVQILNHDFEMPDLEIASDRNLQKYRQLWVISQEYMDAFCQQKLVDYVRNGGHLIVSPVLPKYDLLLKKCTVMRDAFNVAEKSSELVYSNTIIYLQSVFH